MFDYVVIADFEITPAFLSVCGMMNGRKGSFTEDNYWIFVSRDTADGLCRRLRGFARTTVTAFRADADWGRV